MFFLAVQIDLVLFAQIKIICWCTVLVASEVKHEIFDKVIRKCDLEDIPLKKYANKMTVLQRGMAAIKKKQFSYPENKFEKSQLLISYKRFVSFHALSYNTFVQSIYSFEYRNAIKMVFSVPFLLQ